MRVSRYFMPLLKETPKEAEIVSHRLMLRSGMIRQQASGIYSWLPLGKRVLDKVCSIIREEQDKAGAHEILMSTLQSADLWRESGRYDSYGKEMLRVEDRHGRDLLYGPTNEEMVTDIFRSYVRSYRDLPLNLYQIQWKFRDEIRPRFGAMRSREFLMKDAYSFDLDEACARLSYFKMFCAYLRTFKRLGLTAIPMVADTGPIGGQLSHEFIVLADTGESEVFCDKALLELPTPGEIDTLDDEALALIFEHYTSSYAATEEMHDKDVFEKSVPQDHRLQARGIEVGHIFYFGTKYSDAMGAFVSGQDGKEHPVHMGSYGIGPSRLVGALIEAHHDDKGIQWPASVAPFDIGLINLKSGDVQTDETCEMFYKRFQELGFDVLYDDSDQRAGGKFAAMDLIGLPYQLVIGPRGLKNNEVEVKERASGQAHSLSFDACFNFFASQASKLS